VIVKQQIKRLEEPSLKCISMIYDELNRILGQLLQKSTFRRFPNLRDKFYSVTVNFFKKAVSPTNKLVSDLIAAEACYVNTAHPDFITGHKAMAAVSERMNPKPAQPNEPQMGSKGGRPVPNTYNPSQVPNSANVLDQKNDDGFFSSFWAGKKKSKPGQLEPPPAVLKASGTLTEREIMETEVIKLLIQSYYAIVKRTVSDLVPKAIMLNLVFHSKENLQRELLTELYSKRDAVEESVKESEFVQQRREECKKMIAALQKADEIISTI
jgi:dynamin 1-like protein